MVPCARKRTVVIIAEDDPDDRLLLQDAIKESSPSVEVHFVADGAEMLDFLYHRGTYANTEVSHPELILLDLNMPRMDGIELIRQVRALPKYRFLPIIMLTTESDDQKKQAGRSAGASGWIVKPFRGEQLVMIAKKFLG